MILVSETLERAIDLDAFHLLVVHHLISETSSMAPVGPSTGHRDIIVHEAGTMYEDGSVNKDTLKDVIACIDNRYSEVVVGHYFPLGVDAALFSETGMMHIFDEYQGPSKHVVIVSMDDDDYE